MELGIGARQLALGGAAAAMNGSAENFYYNPASLGLISKRSFQFMYAPTFGSLKDPMAFYNYIGFTYPLKGGGTVAFNWTRFSADDIPQYPELKGSSFEERNNDITLRPDGTVLGYFKDTEDVYYFSFAKIMKIVIPLGWLYTDLPVDIPFGVNFKVLRQKLFDASATGMGIDIGSMIRFSLGTLFDKKYLGDFSVGLSFSDITQTSIIWNTDHQDRVQRTILFGLGYNQYIKFLNADLNFYWTQYNKYEKHHLFGTEILYHGIAIRTGINQTDLTFGAGIHFWKTLIDYAFIPTDLDKVHRLSCSIQF